MTFQGINPLCTLLHHNKTLKLALHNHALALAAPPADWLLRQSTDLLTDSFILLLSRALNVTALQSLKLVHVDLHSEYMHVGKYQLPYFYYRGTILKKCAFVILGELATIINNC